jgi:hypothetical protein
MLGRGYGVACQAVLPDEGQEVTHSTIVARRCDQAMIEHALVPPHMVGAGAPSAKLAGAAERWDSGTRGATTQGFGLGGCAGGGAALLFPDESTGGTLAAF